MSPAASLHSIVRSRPPSAVIQVGEELSVTVIVWVNAALVLLQASAAVQVLTLV